MLHSIPYQRQWWRGWMLNSWRNTQFNSIRGSYSSWGSHSGCFGHLFVIHIGSNDSLNGKCIVSLRVANSCSVKNNRDCTNCNILPIITFTNSKYILFRPEQRRKNRHWRRGVAGGSGLHHHRFPCLHATSPHQVLAREGQHTSTGKL